MSKGNGLPEGWASASLGVLTHIRTGKLDANAAVTNGDYPFFTCADTVSRIDDYAFDTEAVLLAGNGSFGVKHYAGRFNAYQRTYVIEPAGISGRFLYQLIKDYIPKITANNRGSTIKYIRLGDITECGVNLPPSDRCRSSRTIRSPTHLGRGIARFEHHYQSECGVSVGVAVLGRLLP